MTMFTDFMLSKEILKAVQDMGFETPSPIQEQTIPLLLEKRDVIGQAQTGTGKTVAFGIPLLESIDIRSKRIQALVLCPTRELAIQVAEEFSELAKYKKGVQILPVYGGQPIDRQLRSLQRGVQIIVGTPGRIMDHMQRKTISFADTRFVVLDEADEMFDMGFRADIETVLSQTPSDSQKVFFSATMPASIMDLARSYLKNPEVIRVTPKNVTVPAVEQVYFDVKPYQKQDAITRLLDVYNPTRCIIFCSTKRGVDDLTSVLQHRGYSADALHGNLSQTQRDRVMNKFRKGSADVLVATDVAARGLDIDEIDLVVNFDMPNDAEVYVHRIGRTGRAGRTGKACTFVTQRDYYKLRDIKKHTRASIAEEKIPTVKDVMSTKVDKILEKVKGILEENSLSEYAEMLGSLLTEETTPLSVAAALIKLCLQNELGEDFGKEQKEEPFSRNTGREDRDRDSRNPRDRDSRNPRDRDSRNPRDRDSRNTRDRDTRAPRDRDNRAPRDRDDSRGTGQRDLRSPRPNSTDGDDKRPARATNPNVARLYFNVGRKLKITPKDILGAITGETNIAGNSIGAIDIHEHCSFVEVAKDVADFVLETMNGNTIRGYTLTVQVCI